MGSVLSNNLTLRLLWEKSPMGDKKGNGKTSEEALAEVQLPDSELHPSDGSGEAE